jgi:hypothetical protein
MEQDLWWVGGLWVLPVVRQQLLVASEVQEVWVCTRFAVTPLLVKFVVMNLRVLAQTG